MNTRFRIVVGVIACQVALMAGLIVRQEYRLSAWKTVRLRVLPVDPIALFRGRYVDLRYEFSNALTNQTDLQPDSNVWIRLSPHPTGVWSFAGYAFDDAANPEEVLISGRIRYVQPRPNGTDEISVTTGIESYFMSERLAPEIESLSRREHEMIADVCVGPDGTAILKQLYVDGIRAEEFLP